MIVYFADRELNILGHASTELKQGLRIRDDNKSEDVETGVAIFECKIEFDADTRLKVENWAEVGNYIIRNHKGKDELYSIIDSELDTKKQTLYIYAEDDGMDLLNEVVDAYEADAEYNIAHYINKAAKTSGFTIGINEVATLKKQLTLDKEQTASARIAEIAAQFDGAEVSYSFKIDGLYVIEKNINIYAKRGSDDGITLYLNKEIDSIVISKTIGNLATALRCTGGTPEGADDPITLKGFTSNKAYKDDGDIYIDSNGVLKSRKALERWKRCLWKDEETQEYGGHITKTYSDRSETQEELFINAKAELLKICNMEVNYESEIKRLPDNLAVGDRVNIVDDAGELYLSTRFLQLEESITGQSYKAVFGEHLIKESGINQKVLELAQQFASSSVSAERAYKYAVAAQASATNAQTTANSALEKAEAVQDVAEQASQAATQAQESANAATEAANNAQTLVESVETDVAEMEEAVTKANAAAEAAQKAADEVDAKVSEVQTAAQNAQTKADEAATAAANAQTTADSAVANSSEAKTAAEDAIEKANAAETTANAAKLDSEAAKNDVSSLSDRLTTVSNTMEADYTRKTELTETEANLQTQISQNAAGLSSHAESLVRIDETTNNAAALAAASYFSVEEAQALAEQTAIEAEQAQEAATQATLAAEQAQAEADTATAAANEAQALLDTANADLQAAQKRLDEVMADEESTEAEIAEAQTAVNTAQAAAAKAQTDAEKAIEDATTAQQAATDAQEQAKEAQQTAFTAVQYANIAQLAAQEAEGSAANKAKETADQAKADAETAQSTANEAKTKADTAKAQADAAAQEASTAQQAADAADAKAAAAQSDLDTAKQNLANVTSRVDATEEEVAAAQEAVNAAQEKADQAKADAEAAQTKADEAKTNAQKAQDAADTAKQAADDAQAAADAAQKAADDAQAAVDALAIRVTKTETDIVQTNEQIALLATKEEVATTLGGYYTKEETNAAISVKSDEISLGVSAQIEEIQVGGRNYLLCTGGEAKTFTFSGWQKYLLNEAQSSAEYSLSAKFIDVLFRGQTVTFSADIQNTTTTNDVGLMFMVYTPDRESGYKQYTLNDCKGVSIAPGESGRAWITAKIDVDTITYIALALRHNTSTAEESTIIVEKPKLEIGNKMTDWTEAPEDVENDVNEAKNSADNALRGILNTETRLQLLEDSISQFVRDKNGESLIIQDGDDVTYYFNTENIDNQLDANAKDIEELKNKTDTEKEEIANKFKAYDDIFSVGTYQNEPCIILREGSTDNVQIITNTRRIFAKKVETTNEETGETETSYEELYVTDLEAVRTKKVETESVSVSGWAWEKRSNGHISLSWKELSN